MNESNERLAYVAEIFAIALGAIEKRMTCYKLSRASQVQLYDLVSDAVMKDMGWGSVAPVDSAEPELPLDTPVQADKAQQATDATQSGGCSCAYCTHRREENKKYANTYAAPPPCPNARAAVAQAIAAAQSEQAVWAANQQAVIEAQRQGHPLPFLSGAIARMFG